MPRRGRLPVVVLCFVLAVAGGLRVLRADQPEKKLYVVGVSHLDTQWWWTIQETIRTCLPATFSGTFALFDKYPHFNFSWEGAFRYMLLEEYYPDLYQELLDWAAKGRWAPAGSSFEAGDVNIVSPESLNRHFLYGNRYFGERLGRRSADVFLPDCFGFGWALPSVAAHCGLTGFSTQKLGWGSAIELPYTIGRWSGPDGGTLTAVLNPGSYIATIDGDLSLDEELFGQCSAELPGDDLAVSYHYFGTGDQGGPVPDDSAAWVDSSVAGAGPIEVVSASSDQLFRDLTPAQAASLPAYTGELLLSTHGTGCYTSQAAMKRFNRRNEQLAQAAEAAAVAADWLGGLAYPRSEIHGAWVRFLSRHFHDDLTGTGIPQDYVFSWNDEVVALNRLASLLTAAVGAVSRSLDTAVTGVPLVVFNPLGFERTDTVEARIRFPSGMPAFVRVFDHAGTEVPSQVLARGSGWLDLLFAAAVPAVGFAVFDVRESDGPCALATGLTAGPDALESDRYRVEIDAGGDVSSVLDKLTGRELLSGPMRLALFDDNSAQWPAWELMWSDLSGPPREFVAGPAAVKVTEQGPVRVRVEISRAAAGSSFVQRVSLAAGEAGDAVQVETLVDWQSPASLLKAVFPLASANPTATYDLGLGTIQRGNNTERLYEVPAQQWADLTSPDASFGAAVLSDCKYGWDKPDDGTLRLTLVHTPVLFAISLYYGQHTMDLGPHRMTWAVHGHAGDWRTGTPAAGARLNQPLLAFQPPRHDGPRGGEWSFVRVGRPEVALRALKLSEEGHRVILRLGETTGQAVPAVQVSAGMGIQDAKETDGMEEHGKPLPVAGGEVTLDFAAYQMRTLSLALVPPGEPLDQPASRPVPLPYDLDVVSPNEARGDGQFGPVKGGEAAYPAELLPAAIGDAGVTFTLGPTGPGQANAVACKGQQIPLEPVPGERLVLLAAALFDTTATFRVGDEETLLSIQAWTGTVGQWVNRVDANDHVIEDPAKWSAPFVKPDRIAWVGTHRHLPGEDDPYRFTYLFRYVLPVPPGAATLTLPDAPEVRVLAASLVRDPNDRSVAASRLHDDFEPLNEPIDWALAAAEEPPPPEPDSVESAETADAVQAEAEPDAGSEGGSGRGGCSAAMHSRAAGWWQLALLGLGAMFHRRRSHHP